MPTLHRRDFLAAVTLMPLGAVAVSCSGSAGEAERVPSSAPSSALAPLPAQEGPIPVAFLLDEGATMIDFAGPWEAFQDAIVSDSAGFMLYTVAPTRASIRSSGGMEIVPRYALAHTPQPKVVVIPAQAGGRQAVSTTPQKTEWIRHVASNADVVMSVCTGAFLLARTGLLDGLSATTHHDHYDEFAAQFPDVRLLRGRRFVDNGKFVTAGGLTSGVDGALHVVARYYGIDAARASASYMEHHGEGWLSGMQER
jgi:transcriptional regulator GlxA family with amidase domain